MTLDKQISPARRGPESAGPGRARLSRGERGSVQVAAVGVAGFCIYGFATGSPSTVGYVSSVIVIGACHHVAAPGGASGSPGGWAGDRRDGDPGRRLINVGQDIFVVERSGRGRRGHKDYIEHISATESHRRANRVSCGERRDPLRQFSNTCRGELESMQRQL